MPFYLLVASQFFVCVTSAAFSICDAISQRFLDIFLLDNNGRHLLTLSSVDSLLVYSIYVGDAWKIA